MEAAAEARIPLCLCGEGAAQPALAEAYALSLIHICLSLLSTGKLDWICYKNSWKLMKSVKIQQRFNCRTCLLYTSRCV